MKLPIEVSPFVTVIIFFGNFVSPSLCSLLLLLLFVLGFFLLSSNVPTGHTLLKNFSYFNCFLTFPNFPTFPIIPTFPTYPTFTTFPTFPTFHTVVIFLSKFYFF